MPAQARRSLMLTAPRQLAWIEEPLPALGAHDVLIETRAGAVSIGSELPLYLGKARSSKPATYPRMTGYESLGVVLACGSAVRSVQPDTRVVSFYGHRTHAVVDESKVIPVPDDVPDTLALLVILTCDAAKGVRKLTPPPEENILITGAGAMGLFTLFILHEYGCANVDVVEPRRERHALTSQLGARRVMIVRESTGSGESYSVGFECSSRNDAFALLQARLRLEGRICVIADGNLEPLTLTPAFHKKELRIIATSDGWDYHQHAVWYFDYLRRHTTTLAEVFQEEIASDDLLRWFALQANLVEAGNAGSVKILVRYMAPSAQLRVRRGGPRAPAPPAIPQQ
jgi:alcohol dehydrogenase